ELASIQDPLLEEVLEELAAGYRRRAEHGQAQAIWTSERDRWATELRAWWQHWYTRLVADWSGAQTAADKDKSKGKRKPEPEQTVPGLFLAAAEWPLAPPQSEQPFLLRLAEPDGTPRAIPFAGVIDRVEVDPPRNRLIICDYKTGVPPFASALAAELRAGTHLQLPLYAIAVEQILGEDPQRLRMHAGARVGALRLEYLRRPPRFYGDGPADPVARGFAPDAPLGFDDQGREWTVREAAAAFALAFVFAMESGVYPLVARTPRRGRPGAGARMHELMRAVPGADQRPSALPPALHPPADPRRAREVVR
ncbi:MAG: PD-(D/E)XK nuclease family protein, partial [Myxococcales bacterium]|nr:PD-(D/E)XK nuclease family protein [Myxococcales bacterium]